MYFSIEGDKIQYHECKERLGAYYHTHWEFDYDSFITDRLCPLTYFDSESLSRINAVWEKIGSTFDGRFPEICSGFYKGRNKLF